MSANSNKIDLSEEFVVMWKKEHPPEVFCEKGVLRNFAKFTGNTCGRLSFLRKLQASACNFIKN